MTVVSQDLLKFESTTLQEGNDDGYEVSLMSEFNHPLTAISKPPSSGPANNLGVSLL